MFKNYIIFFFLLFPFLVSSQEIKGRIINKKDKTPIAFAVVSIMETGIWTTSNKDGYFSFKETKLPQISIAIKHIEIQDFFQTYNISYFNESIIVIELTPISYDMPEVNVISQKGRNISTSSIIKQEAIEHIQPTTLGDVMQLLPGNLIENPNLSDKQTITIREIGNDNNSTFGTSIIIDGVPINNDANYQTYSTSINTPNVDNANGGIDLRQISTDNIKSIEVIKGIPSVKYGNLTSGAIIVETKNGTTPLEIKLKSDHEIKHIYCGKGFDLHNGESLNMSVDYTNSLDDLRSKYSGFNRITGNLSYSNTFNNEASPIYFNTGLSFFSTIDNKKTDPDALVLDEQIREKETGAKFHINTKWLLDKKFITEIKSSASLSINKQDYYAKKYRSTGIQKISLSQISGENEGIYLPSESLTELEIKGLPISTFANVDANKNIIFKNSAINKILLGIEYNQTGNYGEGRIYDISNPPTVNASSSRPRSYKNIPPTNSIALYIEDKHTQPIGNTSLTIQAGLRINNFQSKGILDSDLGIYYEPRLNTEYLIYKSKNNLLKKISLHGGIGINYKAPPVRYIYPDLAYFDLVSLDHYTGNSETSLAYFSTSVFNTTNNNLKPSKNLKKEIGLEVYIGKTKGNVTAFIEDLTDGFGMITKYQFIDYKIYDASNITTEIKPDISKLPHTDTTYIIGYLFPTNKTQTLKYGIEYEFDFGKIDALATRITMNGAWLHTKRTYNIQKYDYLPTKDEAGQYQEIGVYAAGESKEYERLNTTFRFITHSSLLRLVFTTTMQITWYDKLQNAYYDDAPLYLYDKTGIQTAFTEEMRNDSYYRKYINAKESSYFESETLPPLFLFNFKLSKEIYDNFKLSFYANNFFNYRPMYQSEKTISYVRRNPSIYFGAELTIKL